jgi:hypothetical protein
MMAKAVKAKASLMDVVDFISDGTGIGKSTASNRACHFYRETGRPVTRVRIESSRRREAHSDAADTEVFIALEEFTTAAMRTGGLVGVLSPLFEAIIQIPKNGNAVIIDWPGGSAAHRLDVLAATSFGTTLVGLGVRAISVVMTSCSAEHMTQAERHLKALAEVAPTLPRALGLSGRNGPFHWPQQSEQAEAFGRLQQAAGDIPVLRIPFVAGRALQVCADAGLDVAEAMLLPLDQLAARLGIDVFQANACAIELALWWRRTGVELRKLAVGDAGAAA